MIHTQRKPHAPPLSQRGVVEDHPPRGTWLAGIPNMTSQDVVDPTIQEADRRAERAKASLLARVELLKHKITDARDKLDLPAQIASHPWPALGVAFALGVAVGVARTGSASPDRVPGKRSLGDVLFAAAAAFGIRLVRDAALGQVGELARQWWTERNGLSPSEARTGRHADLEPFLER